MREYKCLSKQTYSFNEYRIVPIRDEDRYYIMQWRNEQIYHLRQSKPLDKESQDNYFNNVISKLFEKENPEQILFSYLKNGIFMGYGGLVHINWIDKNAELSFIMNTNEESKFNLHWSNFLTLIEFPAFEDLKIHKIYTFAFDIRPQLYLVLEQKGFYKEATFKEHCFFNKKFIDVIVHSKINES
jgi:RimJ/RimL family protein N-acetyltransferase